MSIYRQIERHFHKNSTELLRLIDALPVCICYLDTGFRYRFVNQTFVRWFGIAKSLVINRHIAELSDTEYFSLDNRHIRAAMQGEPVSYETHIPFAIGGGKDVAVELLPDRGSDGNVKGCYALLLDMSGQKKIQEQLRQSEERWKLALEVSGDGVWDWYPQNGIELLSDRLRQIYGYEANEIPNLSEELDRRTHPADLEQMHRDRQAHFDGLAPMYINEHRVQCKDGSWKWILTRGMVIERDARGRPVRVVGTHTDISERKNAETLIWQQANIDTLTGLPNRRMFCDRLEQDMRKSRRNGKALAVFFIDLDHFKEVNDTLGHATGDILLLEATQRLRQCVRESDTLARLGGDEFTLSLPDQHEPDHVEVIAQNIIGKMSAPFQIGGEEIYVSASIGITIYPDDAQTLDDLLKHADQAMYAAKAQGRNCFSYFTPSLQSNALARMRLTGDLRDAISSNQLCVHFQPIVNLQSGRIQKAEALIRWQHPQRGFISPAEFVPLAEASGLVQYIGEIVFREASRWLLHWYGLGHDALQISINQSPVEFQKDDNRYTRWIATLQEQGLPGSAITIEITEGLLLDASQPVFDKLLQFRDAGIQVALDDFGTGYSSLSYLKKFDIDFLKIDQSFVRNLCVDSSDLVLTEAIIVMAHKLGLKVIAEGVETAEQMQLLKESGCDFAQGYLFSRPVPPQAFEQLLADQG